MTAAYFERACARHDKRGDRELKSELRIQVREFRGTCGSRYSTHSLRRKRPAWDWGSRSCRRLWMGITVRFVSKNQDCAKLGRLLSCSLLSREVKLLEHALHTW